MKCNYMFLTESATMIKSFLLTAKLAEKTKNKNSNQGQIFNAINSSMGTAVKFVILMDSTRSKL